MSNVALSSLDAPCVPACSAVVRVEPLSDRLPSTEAEADLSTLLARASTWLGMCEMALHQPDAALCKWRALCAPQVPEQPFFDHSRYVALRHRITEEWRPESPVERMFIEQLARGMAGVMYWLGEAERLRGSRRRARNARAMAEREFLAVLRTLTALCEQRPAE
jgi:hypothetical protein